MGNGPLRLGHLSRYTSPTGNGLFPPGPPAPIACRASWQPFGLRAALPVWWSTSSISPIGQLRVRAALLLLLLLLLYFISCCECCLHLRLCLRLCGPPTHSTRHPASSIQHPAHIPSIHTQGLAGVHGGELHGRWMLDKENNPSCTLERIWKWYPSRETRNSPTYVRISHSPILLVQPHLWSAFLQFPPSRPKPDPWRETSRDIQPRRNPPVQLQLQLIQTQMDVGHVVV